MGSKRLCQIKAIACYDRVDLLRCAARQAGQSRSPHKQSILAVACPYRLQGAVVVEDGQKVYHLSTAMSTPDPCSRNTRCSPPHAPTRAASGCRTRTSLQASETGSLCNASFAFFNFAGLGKRSLAHAGQELSIVPSQQSRLPHSEILL